MDGITRHLYYPYTSEQIGLTVRIHPQIVEIKLSILAHASIPLKYWDKAFYVATFLSNRLPSSILDQKSSLEILFLVHQIMPYWRPLDASAFHWPSIQLTKFYLQI